MDSIRYEEMKAVYTGQSQFWVKPERVITTMRDLVFMFGQEDVDRMIADGTIQLLKEEDHGNDTGNGRLRDSNVEVAD